MPTRRIEIQFPLKGLNEASALLRQKGGQDGTHTASKCDNVIGYDPKTGRNRGASRAGTLKYCPDRINGALAGQCLVHVVAVVENESRQTGSLGDPPGGVRVTASGVVRQLGPSTILTTGARVTTLVGISGGNAAVITRTGIQPILSGTSAMSSAKTVIFAESFFKQIFFCDGANYKYYNVSANEMITWTAATGGTMPSQESNVQPITNASNATPIVVTIVSHGFSNGDQVTITGVVGNAATNGTWIIENITANTFELIGSIGSGAYASGGSCVRLSGSRCSLIAVWGGRIVLSGLETDPNNIFMSAVGDPFDFDYAPDTATVQQAVAGNVTSGYGKNPDIVTALIPYTDDVMLIGGSHSIRRLVGNPAEGGINVSVTDITGIAFGKAWCQSPEGIIYFFGSRGGIYRINPENGIPNRLTSMTIDERLSDTNLDENIVTLEWDDRAIAVRVYISPINGSGTVNYAWDVRNEAWWPFTYANSDHNPFSVHLLAGNTAADRSILEYGQDGYVRFIDVDSNTDDGNAIESFVYIGPFSGMMLVELYATLSESSGSVTWAICSASSMERALDIAPRITGRIKGGRNACQWPRGFIEHGYLRLSSSGPWAMEQLTIGVEQATETMQRIMRSTP